MGVWDGLDWKIDQFTITLLFRGSLVKGYSHALNIFCLAPH